VLEGVGSVVTEAFNERLSLIDCLDILDKTT
jgi:hypothetical protein